MGVLGGIMTLHPFPAIYCQGVLVNWISAYLITVIWVLLFCTYGYSCFIMLLIRLQIVARPGKFFDCHQTNYYTIYVLLAVFVYIPVPGLMVMSYSSLEDMQNFVKTKFPNNLEVFQHRGIHIFTQDDKTGLVNFVMISTVMLGFLFLIAIYVCIFRETRVSQAHRSNRHIQEHLRNLHNMIIQTTCIGAFITISSLLVFKSFYNDPASDSRLSNTIAYTCLCSGSIPSQILMISRNTAYRNFVLRRKTNRLSKDIQRRRSTIIKI